MRPDPGSQHNLQSTRPAAIDKVVATSNILRDSTFGKPNVCMGLSRRELTVFSCMVIQLISLARPPVATVLPQQPRVRPDQALFQQ